MVEIFINSRTADEPYGAALLDNHLSASFGHDVVFRASKSVRPGDDFAEAMLSAVRRATVLLAVIGPRWLPELVRRDPLWQVDPAGDWVRREIVEAFAHGVRVIPVLMDTTRIPARDLPPDLARLAEIQDVRVHFRDTRHSLPAFVTRLRELIPELPSEPVKDLKFVPNAQAGTIGAIFNEKVDIANDFIMFNGESRGSAESGNQR